MFLIDLEFHDCAKEWWWSETGAQSCATETCSYQGNLGWALRDETTVAATVAAKKVILLGG